MEVQVSGSLEDIILLYPPCSETTFGVLCKARGRCSCFLFDVAYDIRGYGGRVHSGRYSSPPYPAVYMQVHCTLT